MVIKNQIWNSLSNQFETQNGYSMGKLQGTIGDIKHHSNNHSPPPPPTKHSLTIAYQWWGSSHYCQITPTPFQFTSSSSSSFAIIPTLWDWLERFWPKFFSNQLARFDVRQAGICHLFRVMAITCLLFKKDTMGPLTSTNDQFQQMNPPV